MLLASVVVATASPVAGAEAAPHDPRAAVTVTGIDRRGDVELLRPVPGTALRRSIDLRKFRVFKLDATTGRVTWKVPGLLGRRKGGAWEQNFVMTLFPASPEQPRVTVRVTNRGRATVDASSPGVRIGCGGKVTRTDKSISVDIREQCAWASVSSVEVRTTITPVGIGNVPSSEDTGVLRVPFSWSGRVG